MDFAAARARMIESQVRTERVIDNEVIRAMAVVPRENFVPERLRDLAYLDEDLLISNPGEQPARYLIRAADFARLLQDAEVGETDLVLDVGCGTGYSSAVLAHLAASVTALESNERLAADAKRELAVLAPGKAQVVTGPLAAGHPAAGPYTLIVLEGGVEVVPEALFDQLAERGRLAAVVGAGGAATATLYTRTGQEIGSRALFNSAIAALPGFQKKPAFVF